MKTVNIKPYTSYEINESLVADASVLNSFDQMEQMETDQRFESFRQNLILGSLTASVIQTADSGLRIKISSEDTNAIEFYNGDTLYGLMEVSDQSGAARIRITDPSSNNYGIYLDTDLGAGANSVCQLIGINGTVAVGGTASVYYSQLTLGGTYYAGLFYNSTDGYRFLSRADVFPAVAGLDIGGVSNRWGTIYGTNLDVSNDVTVGDDILGVNDIVCGGSASDINMAGGDIIDCTSIGYGVTLTLAGSQAEIDDDFEPTVDNSYDLGDNSYRWNDLYATDVNYVNLVSLSDVRLKENVEPISSAISLITQMNPVSFTYKKRTVNARPPQPPKIKPGSKKKVQKKTAAAEARFQAQMKRYTEKVAKAEARNEQLAAQRHYGLIAQEVDPILPDIVDRDDADGYLSLRYNELVPLLIKAVQELKAEVDTLKNQ